MKLAAQKIDAMPQVGRELLVAQACLERITQPVLPGVEMEDLIAAWRNVLARAKNYTHHQISREQLSVREHMTLILRRLNLEGTLEFTELFKSEEGVPKLVTYFLALLELVREGLVRITQQAAYSPIHIQAAEVM